MVHLLLRSPGMYRGKGRGRIAILLVSVGLKMISAIDVVMYDETGDYPRTAAAATRLEALAPGF